MITIFQKELNSFFGSLIGYVAISFFLLLIGSWMWVLPSTNVLYGGYSSMQIMFDFGPYVLMLLAPAITMGLWSVERRSGMMEVLLVTPINIFELILGKYFASLFIMVFTLTLTLVYYFTIYYLGDPVGNIDTSSVISSYLGLFLLSAVFVSIGLLGASITDNQIVAFLLSTLLCLVYYQLFDIISRIEIFRKFSITVANFGGLYHYYSLSRGVIDTRDLTYFFSVIIIMIFITRTILTKRR